MWYKCATCGKHKALWEFHRRSNKPLGIRTSCKECVCAAKRERERLRKPNQRPWVLKRLYNITEQEYNNMLLAQDHNCEICGKHQSEEYRRFNVDHNHATGAVRGLLCSACNKALGLLEENPEIMDSMIAYVRRYNGEKKYAQEG